MSSFENFIEWFLLIMADKNANISKSDLSHIIFERSMPENL